MVTLIEFERGTTIKSNKRWEECQKYYKEHKDYINERNKRWRENNREKRLEIAKRHNRRIKERVIAYYSDNTLTCKRCGCSDIRALSIDHIDGGGSKHRKENSITNIYHWLLHNNMPSGYQVLCMNCQYIKRIESKENRWANAIK